MVHISTTKNIDEEKFIPDTTNIYLKPVKVYLTSISSAQGCHLDTSGIDPGS